MRSGEGTVQQMYRAISIGGEGFEKQRTVPGDYGTGNVPCIFQDGIGARGDQGMGFENARYRNCTAMFLVGTML